MEHKARDISGRDLHDRVQEGQNSTNSSAIETSIRICNSSGISVQESNERKGESLKTQGFYTGSECNTVVKITKEISYLSHLRNILSDRIRKLELEKDKLEASQPSPEEIDFLIRETLSAKYPSLIFTTEVHELFTKVMYLVTSRAREDA